MQMRLTCTKEELCELVKTHFRTDLGAVASVAIKPSSDAEFCTIVVETERKA